MRKLFAGWDDGNNLYNLGDVVVFTQDMILESDYILLVARDLEYDNTKININCDTVQCAIDTIYGMVS